MSDTEIIQRQFKGVWIPKDIWLRDDINWTQKCLLAEIDSLDNGNGCFASNEWLAKRFLTTSGNIAVMLSSIRKLGLIVDRGFDGRKRMLSVVYRPNSTPSTLTLPLAITKPCIEQSLNPEVPAIKDRTKVENTVTKTGEPLQNLVKSEWAVEFGIEVPEKFRNDECMDAIELWLKYKHEIKDPYVSIGLKSALSRWTKKYTAQELPDVIENSIARGYKGLYRDNEQTNGTTNGRNSSRHGPNGNPRNQGIAGFDRWEADFKARAVGDGQDGPPA